MPMPGLPLGSSSRWPGHSELGDADGRCKISHESKEDSDDAYKSMKDPSRV